MAARDAVPRGAGAALPLIDAVPPSCLPATPPLALGTASSSSPSSASPPPVSRGPRPLSCSATSLLSFHKALSDPPVLGCSHYERKCLVRAPCCPPDVFHCCRFCHDEAVSDHKIDRHSISEMVCMLCAQRGQAKAQPVAESCIECGQRMARYYCAVCRFFDDAEDRQIFHCVKCGICRRGKVEDFFHCDRCNCCYSASLRGDHKCIENVLAGDCPVCLENMFSSTLPVHFLSQCGHAIHESCLNALLSNPDLTTPARCPACKKSIGPNQARDLLIDRYLATYRMPEQYSAWRAAVLCNDCLLTSEQLYHFVFHQCTNRACRSYNTDVLSVKKLEPGCADDVQWRQQQAEEKERERRVEAEARAQSGDGAAAAAADRAERQRLLLQTMPPELADSLHELMQMNGLQYAAVSGQGSLPGAYQAALDAGLDVTSALQRGWEEIAEQAGGEDDDGEEEDEDYAAQAEDEDDDGEDDDGEDEDGEEDEQEGDADDEDDEDEDEDAEDEEDSGRQQAMEAADEAEDDAHMPDIHEDEQ